MLKHVGFLVAIFCIIGNSYGISSVEDTNTDIIHIDNTTTPETSSSHETTVATETTSSKHETTSVTETTTEVPVTTPKHETTSAPPITTVAPTTAVPPPSTGTWEVYDADLNITCIRAKMAVQFQFDYQEKKHKHDLSPFANTTHSDKSSCQPAENHTQILVLEDDEGYVLKFVFAKDATNVYVRNISVNLPHVPETFETSAEHFFVMPVGKSYLCQSESSINLGNVTVDLSSVQLQAFMKNEKDFSQAEDCATDSNMNDIVPIAVACALCFMVVVILLGYLITRRQSRQRGYESV